MKRTNRAIYLFNFFVLSIVLSCNKSDHSFTIEGDLTNFDNDKIYLATAGDYLGYTFNIIDSATVSGGKFSFNGKIGNPEMYYLRTIDYKTIPVFIENSKIKISADILDLSNSSINGSSINEELINIETIIESKENDNSKWKYIQTFIRDNNNSILSPYLVLKYIFNLASYDELNSYYTMFGSNIIDHRYSKK